MNTWILMFFATSNLSARLLHSQISTFNLLSAMLASLLLTECKNKIPVVLHYIIASVVILGMFGWSDELPIWSGLKYLNNGIPSYTCTVCYTTNSQKSLTRTRKMNPISMSRLACCHQHGAKSTAAPTTLQCLCVVVDCFIQSFYSIYILAAFLLYFSAV